jgi:NAD(P)-dependent dehydrogenase (short-subunit alcohol dehydrogenase family)
VKFHLDYQTLAAHKAALTCRRLVLTHMSDDMLNLDGVFLGTKHGIRAMTVGSTSRPKGGSIINLSSVAGIVGIPGQSAYNMTKGGVRLFTKSAALECGRLANGVRVNSVHPGVIETPMVAAAMSEWTRSASAGPMRRPSRRSYPCIRSGGSDGRTTSPRRSSISPRAIRRS